MALALQNQDETYSGVERTAILVMYLERGLAKALLDLMNDEEVRKVGMAMASIDRVDAPDIERIVGDRPRALRGLDAQDGTEFVNRSSGSSRMNVQDHPSDFEASREQVRRLRLNRPPERWRRSWRMSTLRRRPWPWR